MKKDLLNVKAQRRVLLNFLREYPEATHIEVVHAGLKKCLDAVYGGSLIAARQDAGIISSPKQSIQKRSNKYSSVYGFSASEIAHRLRLSALTVTKVLSCVKSGPVERAIARLLKVDQDRAAAFFKAKRKQLRDLEHTESAIRKNPYRSLALSAEQNARKISSFLRKNPFAKDTDIRNAGLKNTLILSYGSLGAARKALGLPAGPYLVKTSRKHLRKQSILLIRHLRKHPDAEVGTIPPDCRAALISMGGIEAAKREAGVIPHGWIRASQKARQLGYTRQQLYHMIRKRRIPFVQSGKFFYVPEDLASWSGKRSHNR